MLYFAFGSNMLLSRMQKRVPSARVITTAVLEGHVFAFHKKSKDGSTKADASHTGNPYDEVHGVLYSMSRAHKKALDKVEGRRYGYAQKWVTVVDADGYEHKAFTYYATNVDDKDLPFHWYKQTVVEGAQTSGVDAAYIKTLKAHTAKVPAPNVVTVQGAWVSDTSRGRALAPVGDIPPSEYYDVWEKQERELSRQATEHFARTTPKAKSKAKTKKQNKKITVVNRRTGKRTNTIQKGQ